MLKIYNKQALTRNERLFGQLDMALGRLWD